MILLEDFARPPLLPPTRPALLFVPKNPRLTACFGRCRLPRRRRRLTLSSSSHPMEPVPSTVSGCLRSTVQTMWKGIPH